MHNTYKEYQGFLNESDTHSLNEFANVSPMLKYALKLTPTMSQSEILKQSMPGDIVCTYMRKEYLTDISSAAYIAGRMLGLAQGGLWISSKMIMDKKHLIGYSANPHKGADSVQMEIGTIQNYLNNAGGMILLRPKATEAQKKKAVNYMKARVNLPYKSSQLLTGAVRRFTRKFGIAAGDAVDQEEASHWEEPLVCSTIIALAYIASGSDIRFAKNPLNVWPRDFIIAPASDVQRVGKYIRV